MQGVAVEPRPGPGVNGLVVLEGGRKVFWQDHKCYDLGDYRTTCCRPMRSNRICVMDRDHKGRCCSVAWCCDGCSRMQRGAVHAWGQDGEFDRGLAFCFLCSSRQVNGVAGWDY